MTRMKIIMVLSVMLTGIITSAQAADYKLVKKSGLISLYEKWITSMNGEKAREVKAEFYVKTNVAEAIALLQDESKALRWNPNASEYKIMSMMEQDVWLGYIRYNIPWPVGDQDCCLQYTLKHTGTMAEITFKSIDSKSFPIKNGVGRISGTRGKWLFEKKGEHLTKVTYTISTNRNNKLPKFITDPIIHDNMLESMALFTTILENK